MADKTIGELPGISYLDAGSLFVAEQQGEAVKVTGKQLTDFSNVETTVQVEQAKASAQEAKTAQAAAEAAILKGPIIQNGTWWVYKQTAGSYQDTGIKATGPQGIPGPTSSVNGISPDDSGNITLGAANILRSDGATNVEAALTGMSSTLSFKPNPNLLDNWCFGNPVNQRGKTEQYGGGYFIDRWIATEGKFALTNNGLTLAVGGVNSWISYRLDVDVEGQIITVSALTSDGKLYSGTGRLTKQSGVSVYFDGGGYVSCYYAVEISMFQFSFARYDATLPITIRAAKLELGSQQTLAHQDANGNWVLNEIPNYGEQLRRCQRYYIELNTLLVGFPYASIMIAESTTVAIGFIDLPVSMRTLPSVITSGEWRLYDPSDKTHHITSSIALGVSATNGVLSKIFLNATTTDLVQGRSYLLSGNGTSQGRPKFAFSADL